MWISNVVFFQLRHQPHLHFSISTLCKFRLLMHLANSFSPDQTRQNVSPYLDPISLHYDGFLEKVLFFIFEKS